MAAQARHKKEHGTALYLASETDEGYVLDEAKLLGIAEYFNGGIYGKNPHDSENKTEDLGSLILRDR